LTASTGTPRPIAATPRRPSGRARLAAGPVCPVAPEHGELLALPGAVRWYCPHQGHAGRPKTHPLGAAAPSRSFFERDDLITEFEPQSDHVDAMAVAG